MAKSTNYSSKKNPSYFEKTFTPKPKEVKISNKKFNALPTFKDINDNEKGGDDKKKYEAHKVDFKKLNADRKKKTDNTAYKGSDKRKGDSFKKTEDSDRRPMRNALDENKKNNFSNDRFKKRDEEKSFTDRPKKPFDRENNFQKTDGRKSSDRNRSYSNSDEKNERTPFKKPYNNDKPNRNANDRDGKLNTDRENKNERPPFKKTFDGDKPLRKFEDRNNKTGDKKYSKTSQNTSSEFYERKKEEWKKKDETARKEYSARGGYKGRPENKIEGFNKPKAIKPKPSGPYVSARGDMYQDDAIQFSHNKKNQRIEELEALDLEQMPLNKYISHCGICSRRDAVEIIKSNRIYVNDKLEINPAYRVLETDIVKLDDKIIVPQHQLIYVLLNKPKDFITTSDDESGRKTVMDLVANACDERIFPVGRLDRNTSGLLLLTNDGDLTQKLSHPKYKVKKLYQVSLDKPLSKAHFQEITNGITLDDGITEVDELAYIDESDASKIGIQIHSGKNRIVRRIFESLGYEVKQLDRVIYANLTKKNLPRGSWRYLTPVEIKFLKHYNSNNG